METKGRGKPGMAQWIHNKKKDGGKVQEMGSESWKTACFWFTRIGPKAGPECSGATPSLLPSCIATRSNLKTAGKVQQIEAFDSILEASPQGSCRIGELG